MTRRTLLGLASFLGLNRPPLPFPEPIKPAPPLPVPHVLVEIPG